MTPTQVPQNFARPEEAAIVYLPTLTTPSYIQTLVGKPSAQSSDIEEFRGIPYGTVSSRWEHSQLRTHLPQDVFDATRNGPKCPQPREANNCDTYQANLEWPTDVSESEFDCLNLFIIRPRWSSLPPGGQEQIPKLPVFVWIHGGAYGFGASTDPVWDPTRLVLQSIKQNQAFIAVALNYRLNIFGFGASSDMIAAQSGSCSLKGINFGLRDQKVALTWISRNIAAFGGDPDKITIAGQSCGASSVHAHLLEAELGGGGKRKALFQKAILQSGALGCAGPRSMADADRHWSDLCRRFQIDNEEAVKRIELLKGVPAHRLLDAAADLGWSVYPLYVDGITLKATDLGCEVLVGLGEVAGGFDSEDEDAKERREIEIVAGDVDAEATTDRDGILQIQNFNQLKSIFDANYPSLEASCVIRQIYGLTPDLPLAMLHERLTRYLTDVMIGWPIYQARKFFASYRQQRRAEAELVGTHDGRIHTWSDLGIQAYRIKFGNPFPGPNKGLAHHCVELVYQFDTFREHLQATDESTYLYSSSLDSPTKPLIDSGIGSPAEPSSSGSSSVAEEPASESVPLPNKVVSSLPLPLSRPIPRTNISLGEELQHTWIRIINDINVEESATETDVKSKESKIKVYDTDRVIRTYKLSEAPGWEEDVAKFEIMGLDIVSGREVRKAVNHGTLN